MPTPLGDSFAFVHGPLMAEAYFCLAVPTRSPAMHKATACGWERVPFSSLRVRLVTAPLGESWQVLHRIWRVHRPSPHLALHDLKPVDTSNYPMELLGPRPDPNGCTC